MKDITLHKIVSQTLIPTTEYVLVNFSVWGISCAAVFGDTESAVKWCMICVENGFNYPTGIYDVDGKVLYSEDEIHTMAYKELER